MKLALCCFPTLPMGAWWWRPPSLKTTKGSSTWKSYIAETDGTKKFDTILILLLRLKCVPYRYWYQRSWSFLPKAFSKRYRYSRVCLCYIVVHASQLYVYPKGYAHTLSIRPTTATYGGLLHTYSLHLYLHHCNYRMGVHALSQAFSVNTLPPGPKDFSLCIIAPSVIVSLILAPLFFLYSMYIHGNNVDVQQHRDEL